MFKQKIFLPSIWTEHSINALQGKFPTTQHTQDENTRHETYKKQKKKNITIKTEKNL